MYPSSKICQGLISYIYSQYVSIHIYTHMCKQHWHPSAGQRITRIQMDHVEYNPVAYTGSEGFGVIVVGDDCRSNNGFREDLSTNMICFTLHVQSYVWNCSPVARSVAGVCGRHRQPKLKSASKCMYVHVGNNVHMARLSFSLRWGTEQNFDLSWIKVKHARISHLIVRTNASVGLFLFL